MLRLRPLAAFMLAIPLLACAAGTADNTDSVRQAFEKKFPQRQVQAVRATPVTGIYEIVLPDRQVVYADAKVKHLFVGDLIDVDARQSLTEARVAELSKVDWKNLPLDLAFKEVRGNGSRKLAVFSDPDCPFCKRLERDSLKGVTNVTIYTFLYPLTPCTSRPRSCAAAIRRRPGLTSCSMTSPWPETANVPQPTSWPPSSNWPKNWASAAHLPWYSPMVSWSPAPFPRLTWKNCSTASNARSSARKKAVAVCDGFSFVCIRFWCAGLVIWCKSESRSVSRRRALPQ